MDRQSGQSNYSQIVESIFTAATLEDAIAWREAMLSRLAAVTNGRSNLTADEVRLHQEAKIHTELALENLRFCLLNNERAAWEPIQRKWQTTAVWMKREP